MKQGMFKYEIPQELSDETVAGALAQLPPWRLEKALAYKRPLDRFLCAEAYILLRNALDQIYGVTGEFSFEYGPSGKPSLKERPDIHFNLSHCSRCVCCIVSSSPVGIDVEDIQYDPALAAAVFSISEQEMIRMSDRPDIAFTRLWTMKESLLKLTGEGLRDDLKDLLEGETPAFEIETNTEHGYVLCSAEYSD